MYQDNARAATLRSKLDVHRPAVAMAAHNPLAAKLAARAGFDAIWGSGFELSASYAAPDASILSMDIHLEMMRAIGEVQDVPVIADIDTDFGNAVNVAYVTPRMRRPVSRPSSSRTRPSQKTAASARAAVRNLCLSPNLKESSLRQKPLAPCWL